VKPCETGHAMQMHADGGIVGFTCLFFATATHHNNLSHWQSKKAISTFAESVAALQLITTSEAVLLIQAF